VLCRSVAGVAVPLLLITTGLPSSCSGLDWATAMEADEAEQEAREELLEETLNKPAVVVVARQHPGEVVGSWVMSGFIRFLMGPSAEATSLRDRFCFHIVPMVNVDGVIHGNSRCTLVGADPNRCWQNPNPVIHPEVHALRRYLSRTHQRSGVELFIDLHGHSQRTSAFFYGCRPEHVRSALFPKLASLATRDVDFEGCRWRFGSSHKLTARAVAFEHCGISNSYTLETSLFAQRAPATQARHDRSGAGGPGVSSREGMATQRPASEHATWKRHLDEVAFSPARSESIGCAVGRAMVAFFRLEEAVARWSTCGRTLQPPPSDPALSLGSSHCWFQLFDGSEEQYLPWLSYDVLRANTADQVLAQLEGQGQTVFEIIQDGRDEECLASDSDCMSSPDEVSIASQDGSKATDADSQVLEVAQAAPPRSVPLVASKQRLDSLTLTRVRRSASENGSLASTKESLAGLERSAWRPHVLKICNIDLGEVDFGNSTGSYRSTPPPWTRGLEGRADRVDPADRAVRQPCTLESLFPQEVSSDTRAASSSSVAGASSPQPRRTVQMWRGAARFDHAQWSLLPASAAALKAGSQEPTEDEAISAITPVSPALSVKTLCNPPFVASSSEAIGGSGEGRGSTVSGRDASCRHLNRSPLAGRRDQTVLPVDLLAAGRAMPRTNSHKGRNPQAVAAAEDLPPLHVGNLAPSRSPQHGLRNRASPPAVAALALPGAVAAGGAAPKLHRGASGRLVSTGDAGEHVSSSTSLHQGDGLSKVIPQGGRRPAWD